MGVETRPVYPEAHVSDIRLLQKRDENAAVLSSMDGVLVPDQSLRHINHCAFGRHVEQKLYYIQCAGIKGSFPLPCLPPSVFFPQKSVIRWSHKAAVLLLC